MNDLPNSSSVAHLQQTDELFRLVADSAPVLIWIAGADALCNWFNRPWLEFRGRTMEQEVGNSRTEGVHPEDLHHFQRIYLSSFEQREPFRMEYRILRHDGVYRWIIDHGVPRYSADGEFVGFIGSCIDITERKQAEKALIENEKLAAVGKLAASIAHEINNPLEAVTNLLYLASQTADADTRLYIDNAQQELMRVSHISRQTLQFRRQKSAPEFIDMSELLRSVLALYQGRLAQGNIQVHLRERKTPPILCYPGEIRQVIANLMGNALDAMQKNGVLHIRLRSATDWRSGIPGLRITFADNGHGMSPEILQRIYDPFFTTKEATGTGLGLWISAGIVEKHHGSIHVRSSDQPGSSGTAFTLILPHRSDIGA